jgi:S-adenosylmethionine:tRNA ribosyltransferase-isomerase
LDTLQPVPNQSADGLDFVLPYDLEAAEPPEERGLARDEVRLLVSYKEDDRVVHAGFRDLPDLLQSGDLLIVNTSGTMNAALPATRAGGCGPWSFER